MKFESISYKAELCRKLIHLTSLWIPIGYSLTSRSNMLKLTALASVVCIIVELSRKYSCCIDKLYNFFFHKVLRGHEKEKNLSGGCYLLISSFIVIYFFPKIIAITSVGILIISDSAASLVGRKYGKTTIKEKSLEGFLAFLISGWITVLIILLISHQNIKYFISASFSVLISAIFELYVKDIDDNFIIPISAAITMKFFL